MRVIGTVNVLEDADLQRSMVRASWIILGVGAAVAFALWLASLTSGWRVLEPVSLGWALGLVVASVVALPVHELVHAAAFVLLGSGDVRVSFGSKDFMLYTSANGAVLPRGRFMAVLLAPSVVVSALFALAGCAWHAPLFALLGGAFHLAGCTGDLGMVRVIRDTPAAAFVRDSPVGIELLSEE